MRYAGLPSRGFGGVELIYILDLVKKGSFLGKKDLQDGIDVVECPILVDG